MCKSVPKKPRNSQPPKRGGLKPVPLTWKSQPKGRTGAELRALHDEIRRTSLAAIAASPNCMTPLQRLEAIARGEGEVQVGDLQAMLSGRVAHASRQASSLDAHNEGLLEMLMNPPQGEDVDLDGVLELIERLSRLSRGYSSEIRRSAEALVRINRPCPPNLKVVANGQNVSLGPQQINNGRLPG